MRWRIELLGGLRVQRGAHLVSPFRTRKAAALLAFLAFHRGPHERESLAEMLWPECDPLAGRNRLRVALSSLRASLQADDVVLAEHGTLALHHQCETDITEFNAAISRAKTCASELERQNLRETALDLYVGRLLPGFFESWIPAAEAEIEENFVQTARAFVAQSRGAAEYQRALEYGQRALSLAPLREELCLDVMQLHADLGHPANALRLFSELEQRLREQWQAAPGAALCELQQRLTQGDIIRSHAPIAVTAAEIPTPSEAIIERRAAFRLPSAPALPQQWTRFFGREADIENLSDALRNEQTRLVTLAGGGGAGKTRLALEVARALQDSWPGAIWFVPLHESREADALVRQIQTVLGMPISPRDNSSHAALEAIGKALAAQSALLVLDNFEQLLPWGAPVVQWLLGNVPQLRLLVTSRAPLQVAGETVFAVSALEIPAATLAPDALLKYESVQLFADRARAADPNFRLTRHNAPAVAAVCSQLEGWPLALELAGAQAGKLRPHQMLRRLRKRLDFLANGAPIADYQHASLRAALEWSYELLSPGARQLFARLSVFRGGFDEPAAREIGEETNATHFLDQLVAGSLVVAEDERFHLLETLREFAREQLSEENWGALQRRHAHYFLRMAQEHYTAFLGCEDERRVSSLARTRPDTDNLRAALNWSLDNDPQTALEMVVAMSSHWGAAFADAAQLAERAIENAPDAPTKLISAALSIAGEGAEHRGDYRRHRDLAQQRLQLVRELGDKCEIAWANFHLGNAALWSGDCTGAIAAFEQSLSLFQTQQDGSAIERQNLAWTFNRLGNCALESGDLIRAKREFERALAAFSANADRDGQASELCQLGEVWARQNELPKARELFERAAQIERELDDARPHPWRRLQRGLLEWSAGDLPEARHYFMLALRGFDDSRGILGLLRSILALGCLLVKENYTIKSTILLSCEAEQRRAHQLPCAQLWIEPRRVAIDAARAELGADAFAEACARGKALTLSAAVKYALEF